MPNENGLKWCLTKRYASV